MTEYFNYRNNPEIDPHLHLWGWEIPVYLYLGGLVAGLMILSGYHILRARWDERSRGHYVTAPLLSLALLSLGMLVLFLDLEHKLYVWRLYLTFQVTSPMSWGSWVLLCVYPALVASAMLTLSNALPRLTRLIPILERISRWMNNRESVVHAIGFANLGLGVVLGIYTGVLLSSMVARPLWNSALLGPLFLFSGLSTGAAAMHLLTHFRPPAERDNGAFTDAVISAMVHWIRPHDDKSDGSRKLARADNGFLTVELVIIALYLIGLGSSTAVHQSAAQAMVTGTWAIAFWSFIGGGVLLPMVLQFLQTQGRVRESSLLPAVLVLGGGLMLRFILVAAGQASGWAIASH